MCTNLIAGLLLLPAMIAWIGPRFLSRYESGDLAADRDVNNPILSKGV